MRYILGLLFLATTLFAQSQLLPTLSFESSGDVQDMRVYQDSLYVATSSGKVDVFRTQGFELQRTIEIPKIKDFMGDMMPAKIYSVDALKQRVLFVSEGVGGYRKLWMDRGGELEIVIDESSHYFIRKARFVDEGLVLLALLTNELILYDLEEKREIYHNQLSSSSFSDFALSSDKKSFASSDESGVVRVVDSKRGEVLKTYRGQNVDRVYSLDYKNGIVLTAGQDRRAAIYGGPRYYMEFDFLLYSAALSEDARLGAIAYNEKNDVLIFEIESKKRLFSLGGARATVTAIRFLNSSEIIVASESRKINYYKLKE